MCKLDRVSFRPGVHEHDVWLVLPVPQGVTQTEIGVEICNAVKRPPRAAIKPGVVIFIKVYRSNDTLRWRFEAPKLLNVARKLSSEVSDLIGVHLVVVSLSVPRAARYHFHHQMVAIAHFIDLENAWYWYAGSAPDKFHGFELVSEAVKLEEPIAREPKRLAVLTKRVVPMVYDATSPDLNLQPYWQSAGSELSAFQRTHCLSAELELMKLQGWPTFTATKILGVSVGALISQQWHLQPNPTPFFG